MLQCEACARDSSLFSDHIITVSLLADLGILPTHIEPPPVSNGSDPMSSQLGATPSPVVSSK
jgi:hypothetical protein